MARTVKKMVSLQLARAWRSLIEHAHVVQSRFVGVRLMARTVKKMKSLQLVQAWRSWVEHINVLRVRDARVRLMRRSIQRMMLASQGAGFESWRAALRELQRASRTIQMNELNEKLAESKRQVSQPLSL